MKNEYLEQYGLEEGYLLIFDFRKSKSEMGNARESFVKVSDRKKRIVEVFC
jgi:hypothetical protein